MTKEELEKENTRLKEINTHTLSQLNLDNGELITQLTKAKELLKRWVNSYGYIDVALCNQTDQFISEAEK